MSDNKPAWGGAPQSSDTSRPGWGGAPQASNTGRPAWGDAPQASNTGSPYMNVSFTEVPEYPEYRIEGVFYKVIRLISGISGEAKIFEIEADGRHFALKLYRPGVHPNHDVLAKVKKLNGNGLLIDIFAHGVWTDGNTGVPYDYEIMEYCGGGSLSDCRLEGDEAKMREYAVKMAAALDLAHSNGILHRDVKPANFLFTDESHARFVLTDWGLAKTLDSKGRAVTDAGRTKIYAAPEMYTFIPGKPTYVNSKADFFSMGMTLLALWMGEGLLLADETELVKKKQEEMLPYPTDGEMSDRLLSLIKDLTRRNPDVRAGFEDVVRWAKEPLDSDNSESDNDSENQNKSNTSDDPGNTDDFFWFLSPEEFLNNPFELFSIPSLNILQMHLMTNGYFKNMEYLLKDDFLLWLARRNPELAGKAKLVIEDPKIDDSIKLYTLLYTLFPDAGWDFKPIQETKYSEPSQYVTPEQLADVITPKINIPEDKNAEVEIVTYSTDNVRAYFRAHEKYSKYADWIEYCFELDSDDNKKKFVPYDELTAAFKAASGLKGKPVEIEINGEKVTKPYVSILLQDMLPEYKYLPEDPNVQDYIAAWLTLFFQEELNADYEKESYFSRSRRYYEFVKNNLPFSNIAKNASKKEKKIKEARQRFKFAKWRLMRKARSLRWLVVAPLLFTIIAWVALLIFMGPSSLVISLKAHPILFSVLTALLPGVITSFSSGSLLKGGIVGAVVFVILWLLFPYVAVALPWIFLVWIMIQAVLSYSIIEPDDKPSKIPSTYSDFSLEEGSVRAEMAEAFACRDKLLPANLPDDYPEVAYKRMKDEADGERKDLVYFSLRLLLFSLLSCAYPICLFLFR